MATAAPAPACPQLDTATATAAWLPSNEDHALLRRSVPWVGRSNKAHVLSRLCRRRCIARGGAHFNVLATRAEAMPEGTRCTAQLRKSLARVKITMRSGWVHATVLGRALKWLTA
jgi:hypothetical protein